MRKAYVFLGFVVVALFVLMSSIFVVDEREKALVLQFGQIKSVKEDPGIGFKIPIIQNVVNYDDRILSLDTDPIEVTPSDDRRLIVDAFARYRIADVEQFRRAIGGGGVRSVETRLGGILIAQTRAVLGSDGVTSNTILSEDRSVLMTRIRDQVTSESEELGIEIIDVRLKQTALPDQNLAATFDRMRAEREREATDERARGEEAAQRVRAQADRTRVELVSEAQREAEITRGEADAQRNRVFAEAFGADAEFFEFYRSLTAYDRALQGNNSTLILSPDSEFFNYLKTDSPTGRTTEGAEASLSQSGAAAANSEQQGDAPAASVSEPEETDAAPVAEEAAAQPTN
ncbi:protease modulator HflC [Palleronia abyssalis]|uniref:Protein HflC n=1 Tax=Palleronia abyssalis TaxID=1501240 RepID=A0A2R8BXK2_9RHOB|nr:protease modulator HflC [Palleronia abyssalis]SPJ24806.1 Modulator of FtsH protease HflC [Palleronia abyssalis]